MKTIYLSITLIFLFSLGTGVLAQEIELPNPGLTPDSPFYFLEIIAEEIGTFFTFGDLKKAERYASLAEERLAEVKAVVEKGKPELAEKTLKRYEDQLEKSIARAEKAMLEGKDFDKVMEAMAKAGKTTSLHLEVLTEIYEKVSEEAKTAVENAMKSSVKRHEKVVKALKSSNNLGEVPEEVSLPDKIPQEIRERIQTRAQQELEIEEVLGKIDMSKSLREICADHGGTPEMCEQFPLEKFESFKEIESWCAGMGGPEEICSSLKTMCEEYGVTTPNECFLLLSISSITTYGTPEPTSYRLEKDPDCPQGHVTYGQTKYCCEDSDLNASYNQGYYIKGTVECKIIDTTDGTLISRETKTDSCDGDKLTEWMYDSHRISFEEYDCPEGCEGGACIGYAPAYEIERREEEGTANTNPAYLGVTSLIIMDNEDPSHYGALLVSGGEKDAVIPNSPAALAGLKEGDIILEFQGEKITRDNALTERIYISKIGTTVSLKVLRGGEEFTVYVKLIERPDNPESSF